MFKNTHEPLVTQEVWDIVQRARQNKRHRINMDEINKWGGLVFCADCKVKMVLHRGHAIETSAYNFMCSTYKKKGASVCHTHYIREQILDAIVLDDMTWLAREHESATPR